MNNVLGSLLSRYPKFDNEIDAKNAVKQAMQEIALCGLGRDDFFQHAAFNGGTALRIFHGLTRFSEDLDFSVDNDSVEGFKLSSYTGCLNNEFEALGINATFEMENEVGFVQRGYIKANCRDILKCFEIDPAISGKVPTNEILKIKLETDTVLLESVKYETKFLLHPYPSPVRLYDQGTLFAGKINAVLTRNWKNRVKGRDLFDYLFYISNGYPLNLAHLESRLKQNGTLKHDEILDAMQLKKMLCNKFNEIDYVSAKTDVMPFIQDRHSLDFWSPDLFVSITNDYEF